MRWRIFVPAVVLVAVAAAILLWPRPGIRSGRTNLILIVIDTLRADRLGCYGYGRGTSTNIDRLARGGVVFETVVANSSWTRPSMASMLTGTYPRRTGVYKECFDVLSDEVVTLAEMFRKRGYDTCGLTANPNLNSVFGFDRGFDRYIESDYVWDWMGEHVGMDPGQEPPPYLGARGVTDGAFDLLKDVGDRPFYLQLLYIDPHVPYDAPADFDHPLNRGAKTDSQRYDAEIAYVDHEVGRFVDEVLERHPDTLIVVTSDHGEGLNDHPGLPLSELHGYTLYDSVLLVPMVFCHPELPSDLRFDQMVQLLDLVPTIAELFDLRLDAQVDGRSLAPVVNGGRVNDLPTQVFSDTQFRTMDKIAVRERGLKLIINRDHEEWRLGRRPDLGAPGLLPSKGRAAARAVERAGFRELYRLPGREHPLRWRVNLRNDVDSIRRLEAAVADFEAKVPSRPPIGRDGSVEVDENERRQLEALGYVVEEDEESNH